MYLKSTVKICIFSQIFAFYKGVTIIEVCGSSAQIDLFQDNYWEANQLYISVYWK